MLSTTPPAARQRPRPDAKIVGGEVSWRSLSEMLTASLHFRRASDADVFCLDYCYCACRRHQRCPALGQAERLACVSKILRLGALHQPPEQVRSAIVMSISSRPTASFAAIQGVHLVKAGRGSGPFVQTGIALTGHAAVRASCDVMTAANCTVLM